MNWLGDLVTSGAGLLKWWVIVAPWEQGVRVRRGKKLKLLHAGVHWKFPFVDRVFRQSTRLRVCELPLQTLTTHDGKSLTLKGLLGYEIFDVLQVYQTIHDIEDTLSNITLGLVSDAVTSTEMADCWPAGVESDVWKDLNFSKFGIEAVSFDLQDFAFMKSYRFVIGDSWYQSGDPPGSGEKDDGEE